MAGFIAAGASLIGAYFQADAASTAASAAQQSAQLQYQIADRIQKRAEYLFDRWKSDYEPMSLALAAEVQALPRYVPQYDTAAARAATVVRRQFTKARRDAQEGLDRTCMTPYCGLTRELAIAEASAAAWAAQAAIRTESERIFIRDQHRRDEQYRMATAGQQVFSNPGGDRIAAELYRSVGEDAARAASANMAGASYFLQRAFSSLGLSRPPSPPPPPSYVNPNPLPAYVPTSPASVPRVTVNVDNGSTPGGSTDGLDFGNLNGAL